MKIGDLVKWRRSSDVGIVIRTFEHKLWRTHELGKKVDFSEIDAEPFAEVVVHGRHLRLAQEDLEVISG